MAGWQRQPAMVRAVNALMRALGGASIKLRIPAPTDGGKQRELGIAAAAYQEAELAPAMVRSTSGGQVEVLISSSALDLLMPAFGANDGANFLRQVQQIVYGDLVFTVTGVRAERFAGVEYMYRMTAISVS